MNSTKTMLAASAAVSLFGAVGAAQATTVATLATTVSSTSLVSTANTSGSGVLDDGGTFTVSSIGPGTVLGSPATVGFTDIITGTYSAGSFTASGGTSLLTSCTGAADCALGLTGTPSTFEKATGTITVAGGGTITGIYTADGGAVSVTDVYTVTGQGSPPPVPLPPAVWLLGSGLLGLVGTARRRILKA